MMGIATGTNYNQNVSIPTFVGSVSLAGSQGGLYSVHGGNRLVPEKLFDASKAELKR